MEPQGQIQTIANDQPEQLSFLGLINGSLDRLGSLKEGLKMAKESLDSELRQSEEFMTRVNEAKVATANKNAYLKHLSNSQNVADIKQRIKDIAAEIKEEKEMLGANAVSYVKQTGERVIKRDGVEYQIALSAKFQRAKRK